MKFLNGLLDACRNIVRLYMRLLARGLNKLSGGKLKPITVTIVSFAAHFPIAWLIATHNNYWAAGLLLVFGLFDALDGELARLQGRASNAGMLLDASLDRMKEVLLYSGAAYAITELGRPRMAVWAVVACGASLCVSYVKAKGETAVAGGNLSANEVNRLFQDGLGRFEIRMTILLLGLVTDNLIVAILIIAFLSIFTAFERLVKISRKVD